MTGLTKPQQALLVAFAKAQHGELYLTGANLRTVRGLQAADLVERSSSHGWFLITPLGRLGAKGFDKS